MKVAKDDQLQSKQRKEALYIQVHTINKIKKDTNVESNGSN